MRRVSPYARRMRSCLALLLFLTVCCSAVKEGPGSGGGAAARLSRFCESWAEAACQEEVVMRCSAADADSCRETQQDWCLEQIPEEGFSDAQADACVEAVKAAYEDAKLSPEERDTVLRFGPPCDRLTSGAADDGESCEATADCDTDSDLTCIKKPGETTGTCGEAVEVGGGYDCTDANAVCLEGFYCDGENCIAEKKEGAVCSPAIPCASAFKCVPEEGTGGDIDAGATDGGVTTEVESVCVAKVAVGKACEADDDCLTDICTGGLCSEFVFLSPSEATCQTLR